MKNLICAISLLGIAPTVCAGAVQTPGAIASVTQPAGTQFYYDPGADLVIFGLGEQTRYTLTVLPVADPGQSLAAVLTALDATQYIASISPDSIAGFDAAGVHDRQQTSDWWLVVRMNELNLGIRVQDVDDAKAHRAKIDAMVESIRFAPASLPQLVSGSYTTGSHYSHSFDSGIGVFSGSGVVLHPDGSFGSSSYAGVSGADVTGLSQGEGAGGWWQVRGNRILAFEPPDAFYNYRVEAFSNGLELYTDSGQKLLWVRE